MTAVPSVPNPSRQAERREIRPANRQHGSPMQRRWWRHDAEKHGGAEQEHDGRAARHGQLPSAAWRNNTIATTTR